MTPQEIAKQYSTMIFLSGSIHEGIDTGDRDEETLYFISKNVKHLEIMVEKDHWTNEDMTAVNQAIADGTAYLGA